MRKERGKKKWGGVRREGKKTKRGGEIEWSARGGKTAGGGGKSEREWGGVGAWHQVGMED